MDRFTFIDHMVGHLLWPIVVLLVVLLFRRALQERMPNLTRFRAGPGGVEADEILGIAEIQIPAIVAVHGSSVPRGHVQADGVTVVPARRMSDLLRALPPILGPERVAWLADRARLRFRPAA